MRARGFSLVEFMIAMTIGLFLIAGLVYLIAETSRSRSEMERSSRQIENGRYALDRISEELRHAGFWSEFFCVLAGTGGAPCQDVTVPPFPGTTAEAVPCTTTVANLQNGMALAIQGYEGGATAPAELTAGGCPVLADDYEPNTDILVVRRASTTTAQVAALTADDTAWIQTTAREYKIYTGNNKAQFTLTRQTVNSTVDVVAPVRRYMVRIFFVSKCNTWASGQNKCTAAADNGTPIPTLKMLELGPGPSFQATATTPPVALAEGIEQLQFDYGIDSALGDGIADGALSACNPCDPDAAKNAAAWSNVVSVQVNLIARNTESSPNYSDDKTYNLGTFGTYTPAAGVRQYRRHAYTAMVRLNNVAMRREP